MTHKTLEKFERSLRKLRSLRNDLETLEVEVEDSTQVDLNTFDDSLSDLEKVKRNLSGVGK